jgi:hypothetical protein
MDIERDNGDAGGLLLLLGQVGGGIRNDPDHQWSIASASRQSQPGNGGLSLGCTQQRIDKPISAMLLRGRIAPNSQRSQALILGGFVGFQALDLLTTHLGLALQHQELNGFMASLIAGRGELVAYAVKGTAIAVLLAILMLMHQRNPRVWQAYRVAGWLSAAGVVANLLQLL